MQAQKTLPDDFLGITIGEALESSAIDWVFSIVRCPYTRPSH